MTQRDIILKVLRKNQAWTEGYKLVKVNTEWGWLGSDATRQCRELFTDGLIDKKREGKYTLFKAKAPKEVIEYKVEGKVIGKKVIW